MVRVASASPEAPAAIIVQQGRLLDFIDGVTQRPETPEEYVRQEIAKSIVREYGYARSDVAVEFTLSLGTRRPRADLVVFTHNEIHRQDHAEIVVECKAPTVKGDDRKEGVWPAPKLHVFVPERSVWHVDKRLRAILLSSR